MKKIVLFDMDGTLTPAREKMSMKMCKKLGDLQSLGFEIGIVTGSDMDYLKQQCDILSCIGPVDASLVHYMPCNGTKYYRLVDSRFQLQYSLDMKEEIKNKNYNVLLRKILNLQSTIANNYPEMPLTGNFINYRGSMINWCPIGRLANSKERQLWSRLDRRYEIRKTWLSILRRSLNQIDLENVVIKLGGETSFDIYPEGWDKTYAFKNFKDYKKIYFVGDRCQAYVGNDYEAYMLAGDKGFCTTGPDQTYNIINKIICDE
jgi:phosphomannomutase